MEETSLIQMDHGSIHNFPIKTDSKKPIKTFMNFVVASTWGFDDRFVDI